jgi:hypothetical protein
VEFRVIERTNPDEHCKAIQIFIGSDVLRAHSADILFSSNVMTLYDNERSKLSIPLSRPESEAAFNGLYVTSGEPQSAPPPSKIEEPVKEQLFLNGLGQGSSAASVSSAAASPPPGKYRPPGALAAESIDSSKLGAMGTSDIDARPSSRQSTISRPSLGQINTRTDQAEPDTGVQSTPVRSGSTSAIWGGSWRRDPTPSSTATPTPFTGTLDWAGASKNRETLSYQRKDTGIKVLKPKTSARIVSSTNAATPPAVGASSADPSKSRFFDEGRRRSAENGAAARTPGGKESTVPPISSPAGGATPGPKSKANPIGGASAFSWLNSGAPK